MESAGAQPPFRRRNRLVYAPLVVLIIGLGLLSRHPSVLLPGFLKKGAGDMLWALMVFVLGGLLAPGKSTRRIALGALLFSALIEFSQLYHTGWIEALREVKLGYLVLGKGFAWPDLLYYATGIATGAQIETICLRRATQPSFSPGKKETPP